MQYKGEKFELVDDFMDIGYMAENIEVLDTNNNSFEIKRTQNDKGMTLLVSFPNDDEVFFSEAIALDDFMKDIQVPIYCYFIFNDQSNCQKLLDYKLKKFKIVYDYESDFGSMYGTKIINGELEGSLTKSLFLISKDGAIFYLVLEDTLEDKIDYQRLQVELNKAFVTYNGQGCHG